MQESLEQYAESNPKQAAMVQFLTSTFTSKSGRLVMTTVTLPGKFYPEVAGRTVALICRQTEDLLELLQLRSFPLEEEEAEDLSVSFISSQLADVSTPDIMGQAIEESAMRFLSRPRPLAKTNFCMCNFPDDRWLDNSNKADYVYRSFGNGQYEIWSTETPERVWCAERSGMQNLVIGGSICMDFTLKATKNV